MIQMLYKREMSKSGNTLIRRQLDAMDVAMNNNMSWVVVAPTLYPHWRLTDYCDASALKWRH